MNLRDFALEIEPGAGAQRLYEIERVLHRYASEVLSKTASIIDDDFLNHRIASPSQAAQICRDEGAQHLNQT